MVTIAATNETNSVTPATGSGIAMGEFSQ